MIGRIPAIDHARAAALLGMGVFHFAYDLEMFGHLAPGTVVSGGWRTFSILVAGSFLFLAGVSLHLAHGRRLRWRAFARRLAMVGGAAGLVTLGTFAVFPERFVYFGILHAIAVSCVIGLAFLRLPAFLTLIAAAAVIALPRPLGPDRPWLDWTGLTATPRPSVDFEPVFPWLAPFLAGLALARLGSAAGLWARLRPVDRPNRLSRTLAWPGRHSLALYLVHQPVLIGLVWAGTALTR
ncbi:Uncharacterized membrane protein [Rhodovulum sp. ES.010]|uniref:heparan-alpha-glucosaminide N-acetyltransferase n=1 Tax=Rhodovulum sp. ES.010 TaxID=1882821 RepID=UPI0009299CD9|nr:heparan-alpha-glucosaminide N-acetyltransferase [Rhodovulum sp. ES.010]SIO04542.1 Uncharacterized membrane protein [Rhodovulum sp. ES.010]